MNDSYPNTLSPEERRDHVRQLAGRLQDALGGDDWLVVEDFGRGDDFVVHVSYGPNVLSRFDDLEDLERAVDEAEKGDPGRVAVATIRGKNVVMMPFVTSSNEESSVVLIKGPTNDYGHDPLPGAEEAERRRRRAEKNPIGRSRFTGEPNSTAAYEVTDPKHPDYAHRYDL